jgi:hypothetical protein
MQEKEGVGVWSLSPPGLQENLIHNDGCAEKEFNENVGGGDARGDEEPNDVLSRRNEGHSVI